MLRALPAPRAEDDLGSAPDPRPLQRDCRATMQLDPRVDDERHPDIERYPLAKSRRLVPRSITIGPPEHDIVVVDHSVSRSTPPAVLRRSGCSDAGAHTQLARSLSARAAQERLLHVQQTRADRRRRISRVSSRAADLYTALGGMCGRGEWDRQGSAGMRFAWA